MLDGLKKTLRIQRKSNQIIILLYYLFYKITK